MDSVKSGKIGRGEGTPGSVLRADDRGGALESFDGPRDVQVRIVPENGPFSLGVVKICRLVEYFG